MNKTITRAVTLALAALAGQVHADECSAFQQLPAVSDVRITFARSTAANEISSDRAGEKIAAAGAAFCRIEGIIEQEIGFELWLPPASQWNGKFLAAGVGGEAGKLNYADMARGVRRGYASASTDTGHLAAEVNWALGRPDRRANFAARANHLLAEKSKALIAAFYGRAPRHAYFVGCSGGGREGLKEMQAYPDDFDGILAGGAGPDQLAVSMRLLWSQYVQAPLVADTVSASTWRQVADAGVKVCDARDGVVDGVVENPAACRFEPKSLTCAPGQSGACLSAAQAAAVQKLYAPLRDESGKALDEGVLPGVAISLTPRSAFAFSLFGKVVHEDPNWDPAQLHIARDLAAARRAWPDLPNDRTDVSAYRARGGKIIYYHGWLDPWILAQLPITYFQQVNRQLGDSGDFFRLFMVPGMGHCRGGGTDHFGGAGADAPVQDADHDMLLALESWVERGKAPERIVASQVQDGRTVRTRPLCPYPQIATYRGAGSSDDAANFSCTKKESEK
jgi:feruloyl esterase